LVSHEITKNKDAKNKINGIFLNALIIKGL